VTVRATSAGAGAHHLALRTDNLELERLGPRSVTLASGASETVVWRAKTVAHNAPWVALVIPDNDLAARKELTGAAPR
jgi:hypothetical protein